MDIVVLPLWGLLALAVWSMIALAFVAAALLPGLVGRWHLARLCALLLAGGWGLLWLLAMAGMPWPLPWPTRPRAWPFVLPVMAFWPALTARLITRYRLAPRASAETH